MKENRLLTYIREGRSMTGFDKLRLIIEMSVPSMLAQLSAVLMFYIDAAMVGQLGAREAASVGIVETTTWLFGGLVSASSMGFSVQVAHSIGANDFDRARRVLRQSLLCTLLSSTLLLLIGVAIHSQLPLWLGATTDIAHDASMYFLIYVLCLPFFQMESLAGNMLKCSGNMKIPSVLNMSMCVLDVLFNYIFIYMAGLGVVGAALGTYLAIVVTAIAMMYFLLFRSTHLSLIGHRGSFRPTRDCVGNALRIGLPMALQQTLMGSAQIVSTVIVAPLGTMAIAANNFAINVESICYMPGYGISEAATTLVGQSIGAGKRMLTLSFARIAVLLGMVVMGVMAVLMYVFAPELIGLMTPVEQIRQLGVAALRIEAFAEPMFAAAIVCYGVFVGAGDTLKPAVMNLVSMWAVRLTLAAWLARSYGLRGVWTAMAIELSFRGTIFLARLVRGKWVRDATK